VDYKAQVRSDHLLASFVIARGDALSQLDLLFRTREGMPVKVIEEQPDAVKASAAIGNHSNLRSSFSV
jgi:hypothetical protein